MVGGSSSLPSKALLGEFFVVSWFLLVVWNNFFSNIVLYVVGGVWSVSEELPERSFLLFAQVTLVRDNTLPLSTVTSKFHPALKAKKVCSCAS